MDAFEIILDELCVVQLKESILIVPQVFSELGNASELMDHADVFEYDKETRRREEGNLDKPGKMYVRRLLAALYFSRTFRETDNYLNGVEAAFAFDRAGLASHRLVEGGIDCPRFWLFRDLATRSHAGDISTDLGNYGAAFFSYTRAAKAGFELLQELTRPVDPASFYGLSKEYITHLTLNLTDCARLLLKEHRADMDRANVKLNDGILRVFRRIDSSACQLEERVEV